MGKSTPNADSPLSIAAVGSGGIILPNFVGDLYAAASLNTASPTTLITGAPGYYLTRLLVEVLPNCAMSGGGILGIIFSDSVQGQCGAYQCYVPATFNAPSQVQGSLLAESGAGYFFRSLTPGSVLSVSLTGALTSGSVRVAVNGGLTPIY
ncbi:hypothetical protein [Paraburkholderia sp. C35]|uniref:hypothetical protein n=1 Tax=Paraburkholderia sp. C35 TaxID=2126993 RepID=UPI000D69FF6C|nr:hypothetical protein [Paraburkholderia sp. C35]